MSSLSVDGIQKTAKLRLTEIFLSSIRNTATSAVELSGFCERKLHQILLLGVIRHGVECCGRCAEHPINAVGKGMRFDDSFAVGMGAGAIPMAAALNWVLKDGLGQLGGMAFTAFAFSS